MQRVAADPRGSLRAQTRAGPLACPVKVTKAKFVHHRFRDVRILSHRTVPTRYQAAAAAASTVVSGEGPPAALEADASTAPGAEDAKFVWTKNWYPVMAADNLDPTKPNPFPLLGKDYVLWCDTKSQWHCFEDRCPHRLAPFSEGWVNGDTLECAYHGWRFKADGACTLIPSIGDPVVHDKACASSRACTASFPVQIHMGLAWVWPESGPLAPLEAAATPPVTIPALVTEDTVPFAGRWYQRDLPHDWEFFIENVVDPAHVVFAHHGVAGINRNGAGAVSMRTIEPVHPTKGFKHTTRQGEAEWDKNFSEFRPPCLVQLTLAAKDEGHQYLALYATPTKKGWVRHLGCTYLQGGKSAQLLSFFTSGLPAWLLHYFSSDFFHGDLTLLHGSNRTFDREGGNWQRSYFTPTAGDTGVANFWNWLNNHAGGKVPYPPGADAPPPPMKREEVLDRYEQHTKHCVHCKKALATTEQLQLAARVAACALLGISVLAAWAAATAATAAAGGSTAALPGLVAAAAGVNPTALLLAAAALVVAGQLLEGFKKGFYFVDFHRPA